MLRRSLLVAVALMVVSARASDEGIVTVLQPLDTSGAGNIVSAVTYIGYTLDWENPASELMLTVQPNLVWCDGKAQDRNGAVVAGIKFKLTSNPAPARADTTADTLRVIVDLAAFAQGGRHPDEYDHYLLTSTLWCGLRNARLRWPRVRFVQYVVQGHQAFAHYSDVYSLEHVAPSEAPEQWGSRAGPDELRKE